MEAGLRQRVWGVGMVECGECMELRLPREKSGTAVDRLGWDPTQLGKMDLPAHGGLASPSAVWPVDPEALSIADWAS